jgi:hypothetical protein
MSQEGLDALRARVSDDPELAQRLYAIESERFVEEVTGTAAALGYEVTDDVRFAITRASQAWMLRWVR